MWQNRKCAVSLTYDDALNVHLDTVVPHLDSLGFRGTFYLSGFFPSFRNRATEWRRVAERGHELGNHTLFHPCDGTSPGREWVKPDYALEHYTVTRLLDEIAMANVLLKTLDGRETRTFAYPCGDTKVGDSSYVEYLHADFAAARGVHEGMQTMDEIDLYNVRAYMVSGQSGEELIGLVKEAMKKNALLVFLFHGVGGEHTLNVSASDHRLLLRFLRQNEKDIWVAPLISIAEYIKTQRSSPGRQ